MIFRHPKFVPRVPRLPNCKPKRYSRPDGSGVSPAVRAGELWVAVGSEEVPPIGQFSAQAGNGTVGGISELEWATGLEPASGHPTNGGAIRGNPTHLPRLNAPSARVEAVGSPPGRKKREKQDTSPSASGAGDGARTRYLHLGKVALYQMSYARRTWSILADASPFVKRVF